MVLGSAGRTLCSFVLDRLDVREVARLTSAYSVERDRLFRQRDRWSVLRIMILCRRTFPGFVALTVNQPAGLC